MASGNRTLLVPVTSLLETELSGTADLIEAHADVALNDAAHFVLFARRLERVALAILAAPASGSLVNPPKDCARFDFQPGSTVAHQVNTAVQYLRDTSDMQRADHNLSRFTDVGAVNVRNQLQALRMSIVIAVMRQATKDLNDLKDHDPVGVATWLASQLAKHESVAGPIETQGGSPADFGM